MTGIGHLNDNRVDHWQVQTGGHSVVQQAGINHAAVVAHVVLLIQGPANSLHRPTLHLPLHVARVYGLARILHHGEPQNVDLAGFRVYLHVHN